VVEVNPIGGYKKEILIAPDPAKLLAYQVSQRDLLEAVEANNANRGAGYIEHNGAQWLMRVPGQAQQMEELGDIVIRQHEGVPLHVRDVASVSVGQELRTGAATQNGREVVMSTVFMLIGENSRAASHSAWKRSSRRCPLASLPQRSTIARGSLSRPLPPSRRICSKVRCSWLSCSSSCSVTFAQHCSRQR
jgi:Cu/Ag efflux pump CusA